MTISASVREIGFSAFRNCKNLKCVIFTPGSRLEKIREQCFFGSGIEDITIPNTVFAIENSAFSKCKNLKRVIFTPGS